MKNNNSDDFNLSAEADALIYKKIQLMQSSPKPASGSVWYVENFGRILVLNIRESFCRYVYLSNNTHFAMQYDAVFMDKNVSFKELAAHTHFTGIMPLKRLFRFDGYLDKEIFEYLLKIDSHIEVSMPAAVKKGESEYGELYDEWSDMMFALIGHFEEEAAAKPALKIFDITRVLLDRHESSDTAGYRLAADSRPAELAANSLVLLSNDDIKITVQPDEKLMRFKVFLTDDTITAIDEISFSFAPESKKLKYNNIPVELNEASVCITDKEDISLFLSENIEAEIIVKGNTFYKFIL